MTLTSRISGWLLLLILSILSSLVIGLCLIWMSIDRADTAFRISQLQNDLSQRVALNNKLEVERDRLLAPEDLRHKAAELGLHIAGPGQVRHAKLPKPGSGRTGKGK